MVYNPVRFVRDDFVGPLQLGTLRGLRYADNGAHLAWWLLIYIDAIVVSEDAGMFFEEIHNVIEEIKRRVDRPADMRAVGECPTPISDIARCCNFLRADRDAEIVKCEVCEATHSVEKVVEESLSKADHMPWTAEVIWGIVEDYGLQLKARTWRDWRQTGVVRPCLYQRPNGRIGIAKASEADVPLYRLSDVREAITTKGQHGKRETKRGVRAS